MNTEETKTKAVAICGAAWLGLQSTVKEPENIEYKKPPELPSLYGNKQFKCKGKHQYRKVKAECGAASSWVCECGRNINS